MSAGTEVVERARRLLERRDLPALIDLVGREATLLQADPAAIFGLAGVLLELGAAEPALGLFESVRRRLPFHPSVEAAVGQALVEAGRAADAAALLRNCLARAPGHPGASFALARAVADLGGHVEAAALYSRILEAEPANLRALVNRAEQLLYLGRRDEARALYDAAVVADPSDPNIRLHRAALLLAARDPAGWADWERRLDPASPASVRRGHRLSRWDGSPIGRLLVDAEQGIGEQILFAGEIDGASALATEVILECHPRLRALFARSFPHARVEPFRRIPDDAELRFDHGWLEQIGLVDAHIECGSLPALLRPGFAPRPAAPYLRPDPGLVGELRRRYDPDDGRLLVGVAWHSGRSRSARHKGVPLAQWRAILDAHPGVRFVSLQYDPTVDADPDVLGRLTVDPEVDPLGDMDPCAAQAAAMDTVVAVSCTAAHLAAAVGTPTLLLTPSGPGLIWYWGDAGERSPWYPALRHLRQGPDGTWGEALRRAGDALVEFRLRGRARS